MNNLRMKGLQSFRYMDALYYKAERIGGLSGLGLWLAVMCRSFAMI